MIEHHHTIKELPVVFKLQSSLGLVQQAETVIVAYQATLKLKNISNAHQLNKQETNYRSVSKWKSNLTAVIGPR
jgi:hypothetical protein